MTRPIGEALVCDVEDLQKRIRTLENQVKRLQICHHEYEMVGGVNTNYRVYFNGGNAYIRCIKCGHRQQA